MASTSSAVDIIVPRSSTTSTSTTSISPISTSSYVLEDSPSNTNTKINGPSNPTSTSSSEKKTTKLSTSSINESTNLNSPSALFPSTTTTSTVEATPSTTANKTMVSSPHSNKKICNSEEDANDDEDDDDDEEETCSTTVKEDLAEAESEERKCERNTDKCHNAPRNSNNNNNEELEECFPSSYSDLSNSSSGERKIATGLPIGSNGGNVHNCIDVLGGKGNCTNASSNVDTMMIETTTTNATCNNSEMTDRERTEFLYQLAIRATRGRRDGFSDYHFRSDDEEEFDVDKHGSVRMNPKRPRSFFNGNPNNLFGMEMARSTRSPITQDGPSRHDNETNSEVKTIKWDHYPCHIVHGFESLLKNETFCDVKLLCDADDEGGRFVELKAHKTVLSAGSTFLGKILTETLCTDSIVLKGYQAWEIRAMLTFMYTGELNVSMERKETLLKSAEALQIRGLLEAARSQSGTGLDQDYLNNNNNKYKRESGGDRDVMDETEFYEGFRHNEAMNLTMKKKKTSSPETELPKSMGTRIRRPQSVLNPETSALPIQSDTFVTTSTTRSTTNTNTGNVATTTGDLSTVESSLGAETNNNNEYFSRRLDSQPFDFDNEYQSALIRHHQDALLATLSKGEINEVENKKKRKQSCPQRTIFPDYGNPDDCMDQDIRTVISSPSPMSSEQQNSNLRLRGPHTTTYIPHKRQLDNPLQDEEEINGIDKDDVSSAVSREDNNDDDDLNFQHLTRRNRQRPRKHHHEDENGGRSSVGRRDETQESSREGGTLMTPLPLPHKRRSRRFNQFRDLKLRSSMNLRNNRTSRSNNHLNNNIGVEWNNVGTDGEKINNNRDKNTRSNGGGMDIDEDAEEQQRKNQDTLDYNSEIYSMGNNTKHGNPLDLFMGDMTRVGNNNCIQNLTALPMLPFSNWPHSYGAHNNARPPPEQRLSPFLKLDGESDDGLNSTVDQCQSPSESPDHPRNIVPNLQPFHFHGFPVADHPIPNFPRQNQPSSLGLNQQCPSPYMLRNLGPIPLNPSNPGGEESGADTHTLPSIPLVHQVDFSLPGNNLDHENHPLFVHGRAPPPRDDTESGTRNEQRGNSRGLRGGMSQRKSPPGWSVMHCGRAQPFGRHRAQHSAPRGGPPRSWSNMDLISALDSVWQKKMTTSQASRQYQIPYNSLLMYVRGKYGKSLKLDEVKRGYEERSAKKGTRSPTASPLNTNASENSSSGVPNISTTITSTPSPILNSARSTPTSVKVHSGSSSGNGEYNNNVPGTSAGMGHTHSNRHSNNKRHPHSHSHKSSSKSSNTLAHHNNNQNAHSNNNNLGGLDFPPDVQQYHSVFAALAANPNNIMAMSPFMPPLSMSNQQIQQHHFHQLQQQQQQQQHRHQSHGLGGTSSSNNHSGRNAKDKEEDDKQNN